MKLVVQIQLIPDTESARKLRESVERFNEAANWLAGVAFDQQISDKIGLQKIAYREVRERFSLFPRWLACASTGFARLTGGTRARGPSSAVTPRCPTTSGP